MPPENKSQNIGQVLINIKKSISITTLLFLCLAVYWYVYSLSFGQALVAGAGFALFFNIVLFGLMVYLAFTYKSPHSKLRHVWGDDLLKIIGVEHSSEPTIQSSRRNIIISISLLGVNMLALAIIGYYGWYQLKASGAVIDNDRCKVFFDQSKPERGDYEFKLPVICTFDIGKDFKNWLFIVSEKPEIDTEPSMYEIEIKNKKRDVVQTIRIERQGSPFRYGFLNMANDINFDGYRDAVVLNSLGSGNISYDYWIFNPDKKIFKKDPVLSNVPNPEFDADKKIITSFVVYDAYSPQGQKDFIYQFINGQWEINSELPPQVGLPAEVEAKRQAIYLAALSRDYEKLANETATGFVYCLCGEYEGGFIEFMKLSGEIGGAFDTISTLLKLPYVEINGWYFWPSVYAIDPSKWTEEDVAMMQTFLTDEQIEEFREWGWYIDFRIAITPEGKWIQYLAGD